MLLPSFEDLMPILTMWMLKLIDSLFIFCVVLLGSEVNSNSEIDKFTKQTHTTELTVFNYNSKPNIFYKFLILIVLTRQICSLTTVLRKKMLSQSQELFYQAGGQGFDKIVHRTICLRTVAQVLHRNLEG